MSVHLATILSHYSDITHYCLITFDKKKEAKASRCDIPGFGHEVKVSNLRVDKLKRDTYDSTKFMHITSHEQLVVLI